jgi:Raf kinase inhibitor-like YbhB/YbcL family protein
VSFGLVSRISAGEVESRGSGRLGPTWVDNRAMRRMTSVCLAVVAILAAGCTSAGTGSGSPTGTPSVSPAVATPPSAATAAATAAAGGEATVAPSPSSGPLGVSSPAFKDGAAIPGRFTCDGDGISPEIDWSGAPAGAKALALTVIDPDAGGFVHWLVYDIPPAPSGSLAENVGTSAGAPPQGANGRGKAGYTGPCPPSGTHHYVFTLYALDRTVGLTGTPSRAEIEAAMKGHELAKAVLTGTYKRS